MDKQQEEEFKKFEKKWFVERFTKRSLHIDDVRELIDKIINLNK